MKENNKKISLVGFIGAPNSGKSTLFNCLIKQKISSVTHKVHTTRENIRGILTTDLTQLVFIDTPGFLQNPKFKLEKSITKKAFQEVANMDFICIILDAAKKSNLEDNILLNKDYYKSDAKIVLLLNKIDLLADKNKLLLFAAHAKKKGIDDVFMISALKNKGITDLENYLIKNSPDGDWLYSKNEVTDRSVKEIAQDITMEKLYMLLNKEIPYSLKVETELWKEDEGMVEVHHVITVLKENQKKIILGNQGDKIKQIRLMAQTGIKKLLGNKRVELFLFIKVRNNWL